MPSGSLPKNYTKMRTIFSSSRAAIDLASIMVGVIIIGIIGGVIASTIFAIIPWAQDNAAKASLDSVHTAESAYAGFSVGQNGGQPKEYGNYDDLKNTDGSKTDSLLQASDKLIITTGSNSKDCYLAVITSDSGNQFWIDNERNVPKAYVEGDQSNCADLETALGNGGTTPIGNGAQLSAQYYQSGSDDAAIYHLQPDPYNFGTLPDPTCTPGTSEPVSVTALNLSVNGKRLETRGDWGYYQYEYGGNYYVSIETYNGSVGSNYEELKEFVETGVATFIPEGCADSVTFNLNGGTIPNNDSSNPIPSDPEDPQPSAECARGERDILPGDSTTGQTESNLFDVDAYCYANVSGNFVSYEDEAQTLGKTNFTTRTDGCWADGTWAGATCSPDGTRYSPGSILKKWDAKNGTTLSFYKTGDSTSFYDATVNTNSETNYKTPRIDSVSKYYVQDGFNQDLPTVEFSAQVKYNQANSLNGSPAEGTTANSCIDEVENGKVPTTYESVYGTVSCMDYNFEPWSWRYTANAGIINPDNYDAFKAFAHDGGSVQFTTVEGKNVTVYIAPGTFNQTPQNT